MNLEPDSIIGPQRGALYTTLSKQRNQLSFLNDLNDHQTWTFSIQNILNTSYSEDWRFDPASTSSEFIKNMAKLCPHMNFEGTIHEMTMHIWVYIYYNLIHYGKECAQ